MTLLFSQYDTLLDSFLPWSFRQGFVYRRSFTVFTCIRPILVVFVIVQVFTDGDFSSCLLLLLFLSGCFSPSPVLE